MNKGNDTFRYELGLVAVAAIWGINFPVVKSALEFVGPLTFNAIRFTISALFLGLLYSLEVRRQGRPTPAFPWKYVIGLGLLGHFTYQLLFILGIDRTSAGNSAFLISSSPLWTALVARVMGYERLTALKLAGLGLAFLGAGVLVLANTGISFESSRLTGNLLSLAGAVAWGSFTALSRPALRDHSPVGLAFWTMLSALPFLWLVTVFEPANPGWSARADVWIALAYSGLLSIGVAYVIWNIGIRHVGPSHTSAYANMVPVIALLVGLVWLGETVSATELGGAMLILAGLYLVRR